MTRGKSLALVFYVGAALAGAAVGVSVDRMMFRAPGRFAGRAARERFFDQLQLAGAQRDSAAAIYDDRDARLKTLMDSNRAVLAPLRAQQDSLFEEGRRRLALLLTPDQKAIYDQIRRERERAQRTEKRQ